MTTRSVASNQRATPAWDFPAAELMSFLRDYSAGTWSEREVAARLRVGITQAKEALGVLEMEGYIEPAGTTANGARRMQAARYRALRHLGSTPRFTPGSVEAALNPLRDRINTLNADPSATYSGTKAAAFGDFFRELPPEYKLHPWAYDWSHAHRSR